MGKSHSPDRVERETMRALTLVVALLVGCSAPVLSTDATQDTQDTQDTAGDIQKKTPPPATIPGRPVFLECEWACPPGGFPVREVVSISDAGDADVVQPADTQDTGPANCDDGWSFSKCCGDGECQRQESAFFCPADCS